LLRGLILNIQKGYVRILHRESFDEGLAYAGGAARHYNDAIAKAWIRSKSISFSHGAIFLVDSF
jgi:hypothetical protein